MEDQRPLPGEQGFTEVPVPRMHYDDFVKHPGWWCVQRNPGLAPGERFRFVLVGGPVEYLQQFEAVARDVRYVNAEDPNEAARLGFDGWYVIEYDGWFVDPPAHASGGTWNADMAEAEWKNRSALETEGKGQEMSSASPN